MDINSIGGTTPLAVSSVMLLVVLSVFSSCIDLCANHHSIGDSIGDSIRGDFIGDHTGLLLVWDSVHISVALISIAPHLLLLIPQYPLQCLLR